MQRGKSTVGNMMCKRPFLPRFKAAHSVLVQERCLRAPPRRESRSRRANETEGLKDFVALVLMFDTSHFQTPPEMEQTIESGYDDYQ